MVDGYTVVRNLLNQESAELFHQYLIAKAKSLVVKKTVVPHLVDEDWDGRLPGQDWQCTKSYGWYGDSLMDTLLVSAKDLIGQHIGFNLKATYSYCRLYQKDEVLSRHRDRESCEHSTTICLGGDPWSFFIQSLRGEEKQIGLNPGDAVVYQGSKCDHWRDHFYGNQCAQVFLHYQQQGGMFNDPIDNRVALGVPSDYDKEKCVKTINRNLHYTGLLNQIINNDDS